MALHLSQRVPKYRAMYQAIKSRKLLRKEPALSLPKGHFILWLDKS